MKDKNYNLTIHILSFYFSDGAGWIKLFKWGIHFKDTTKHRLYFSERNGYTKRLVIGKYSISWLNRSTRIENTTTRGILLDHSKRLVSRSWYDKLPSWCKEESIN